jgi:transcriptional/translational regulatory protein YebC/TACO1
VAFLFDKKGQLTIDAGRHDEDSTLEAALDAGAEDFRREEDQYLVTTSPSDFHAVKTALEAKRIEFVEAEPIVMVPKSTVKVEGKNAEQLLKLMEEIEDLDDVQKVWANFDIDVADMAASAS